MSSRAPATAPDVDVAGLSADSQARPRLVAGLARTVLDVFYRQVQVVDRERVPESQGIVYVGNHVSSLLDSALLLAYMPRAPRFLAKSTLWQMPVLRPFLRLAAAIPVYRRQDPGVDPAKNAETFARCHEVLAAGGAIALLPEGISHNEPGLVPLKTGVSRIVLQTLHRFPEATVRVVPVGLTFDDKTRFRSRVLIRVGEALDANEQGRRFAADPEAEEAREAVSDLTERIRQGLEEVTLNYPSWEEAALIERAASLYARPSLPTPAEEPLAEAFPYRHLFIDGYATLLEAAPEATHRVAEAVREYDARLELYGLTDAQLASDYPSTKVIAFTARSLLALLVRLPLGALGTVLNWIPYRLTGVAARRMAEGPDTVSTYKVFPALFLFPLFWGLLALVCGLSQGWEWGLVALFSAPISGLFAIRFHQRLDHFLAQARAFLLLRSGRRGIADLRRRRRRVLDAVAGLVATYRKGRPEPMA
ncbi:MAG: 1-acyl-sn-glycerol-3-phosphate acyltransferase [Holophagales bacterium]|nr:1-acyl-sn-glycerol-3-phosphate acyltransferase [Holophagales bacterium]